MEDIVNFYEIFLDPLKVGKRLSRLSDNSSESIAEHSWSAAMLALVIGERLGWEDTSDVVAGLLCHDLVEAITGDIPSCQAAKHKSLRQAKKTLEKYSYKALPEGDIKKHAGRVRKDTEFFEEELEHKIELCDKLDWILQQIAVMDRVDIPRVECEKTRRVFELARKFGLDPGFLENMIYSNGKVRNQSLYME